MRQEHAESNRELRNGFKELEKSQSFLAEKFEGINKDIKDLKLGQHFLKGQVDEVHESTDQCIHKDTPIKSFQGHTIEVNAI
ncbi:hypothetical protein quinque_009795 [Culex quinquefasciatus]